MVEQDFNGEFLPDPADVEVARLREENARLEDELRVARLAMVEVKRKTEARLAKVVEALSEVDAWLAPMRATAPDSLSNLYDRVRAALAAAQQKDDPMMEHAFDTQKYIVMEAREKK